jgi:protein xylosyltransferase
MISSAKPVRIVFFLTLNGRALRQVIRLIKLLFQQKHYFYIHVDAVSYEYERIIVT